MGPIATVRSNDSNRALKAAAIAALLLGIALRLYGLDSQSMWSDEVSTVRRTDKASVSDVVADLKESPFPPLYYIVVYAWTTAYGDSDLAYRSLPALLGILTLPVTFFTWRGLIGERAACWAVLLLSLNAYHVFYSQDAKMYAAVWLLATLSAGAFLHLMNDPRPRRRWRFLYGLSAGCLPLVSYVGLAPLAGQFCYAILNWGDRDVNRRTLQAFVIAGVCLLPFASWIPYALQAVDEQKGIGWIPEAHVSQLPFDLANLFSAFLLGFQSFELPPAGTFGTVLLQSRLVALTAIGAVFVLVPCALAAKRRKGRRRFIERLIPDKSDDYMSLPTFVFLYLWWLVPVALTIHFSLSVYSLWGVPRYLTAAAPAFLLSLAVLLSTLRLRLAVVVAAFVVLPNLAILLFAATHHARTPWREVAQALIDAERTLQDSLPTDRAESSRRLIVAAPGKGRVARTATLRHAVDRLDSDASPLPLSFSSYDQALRQNVPFVLLHWSEWGEPVSHADRDGTFLPDPANRVADRPPGGYSVRLSFAADVSEEPFTAMPTPHVTRRVELWLFTPTPLSQGEKAR